jgi:ribose transport system permease protein
MIGVGPVAWWVLERTPVGRYLYALGDNSEAARLTGLPTTALTMGAFVASGTLAGLAGVLEAANLGAGNPTLGASMLLPAFAAAFLGATIFRMGQYNVFGTVIAMFVVAVGIAGLQQVGVPFYVGSIFTGLVVLGAVVLTRFERPGARTAASGTTPED